ncbi:ntf2 [Trichoderma cornu-damae]|uniref:Ntf2 n=1 Tax=Trichoderma cornu-damae TaxID=654480 RepID=A0A9P8QNZ9_9HYPO|nr:ntf2 [Trichoderma cornu-damae]
MAATYKQFLASPSSSLLADKASLHYVTTLTSFVGATEIIKHLNTLQKQVKKKKQEVLSLVDGQNVIAVEVDTGIEFITSGGVYLPGLDDNFLSDRVAYLPIMHIVTFDEEGKIAQIRQQWDQGSLLKQLEIIGKSGRNWPIKDGREQLTLIQSCIVSSGSAPTQAQNGNGNAINAKPRNSSTNIMRDPHASLHLFSSREEVENAEPASVVSPYAGQKPKQRAFTEILTDEPEHWDDDTKRRSMSPAKIGAGKNVQPIRIFDGQQPLEDDSDDEQKPPQYIRAHPAKYQHFALGDGSEESEDAQSVTTSSSAAAPRAKSKHDSQWSFEDFSTPVKAKPARGQGNNPDVRRWDTGETQPEPVKAPFGKARRDAETHFELQDDGELPPGERRIATRTRGAVHNENLGLYKNNVFDREAEEAPSGRALGNITNAKDRGKDFDPQFTISDDAPAPAPARQPVPENRQKAVKMMNANWTLADESPATQKENRAQAGKAPQPDSKIHIAGDGMGGKKGAQRDFLYGGDDAAEPHKQLISRKANHGTQKSSFWDT